MFSRFRNLSIQNKLFVAFASTIVIAAFSLLVSMATLLRVQDLGADLKRIYQTAQRSYQAQRYLQEMERVEKTFILTGEEENLDNFLIYLALFDEYIRLAKLEAASSEIKGALFEIERAKINYTRNFEKISRSVVLHGTVSLDEDLIDQTIVDMNTMNEQLFVVSQFAWENFTLAEERQQLFLLFAIGITVLALMLFLVLAAFTVLIISRGVFGPAALLSQATRAVTNGEFSPEMLSPILVQTDEIGQLADAFIEMVSAAEASERELLEKIEVARARLGGNIQTG
jgi:HAMP domain-containing protein